jgi:hypothetical protein
VLERVAKILVEPVEIEDADQAAQQDPKRKGEGLKDGAAEEKKAQNHPVRDFKSSLKRGFFYPIHFFVSSVSTDDSSSAEYFLMM